MLYMYNIFLLQNIRDKSFILITFYKYYELMKDTIKTLLHAVKYCSGHILLQNILTIHARNAQGNASESILKSSHIYIYTKKNSLLNLI